MGQPPIDVTPVSVTAVNGRSRAPVLGGRLSETELATLSAAADIAVDVAATGFRGAAKVTRTGMRLAKPLAGLALRPPGISRRYWPQTRLEAMAERGRAVTEDRAGLVTDSIRFIVETVLDQVDIDAIAARIDLDAIVARIDLPAIAQQVIEEIDLPEIIRESSGAMASETVIGVRMRAVDADERVARIVDKVMMRRRRPESAVAEVDPDDAG